MDGRGRGDLLFKLFVYLHSVNTEFDFHLGPSLKEDVVGQFQSHLFVFANLPEVKEHCCPVLFLKANDLLENTVTTIHFIFSVVELNCLDSSTASLFVWNWLS